MRIYGFLAAAILGAMFLYGCASVSDDYRDYSNGGRSRNVSLMDVEWATALPTPDILDETEPPAPSARLIDRQTYADLQAGRLAPDVVPRLPLLEEMEVWRPETAPRPTLVIERPPVAPPLPPLTNVPDISSPPR